ncbi:MAG: SGNH/GDSL hydrolase family protein [Lachnospiraceae bacterium]|nr:SGNH/GDSL hydrolase family protein [Lachnospiraceae bacterium]
MKLSNEQIQSICLGMVRAVTTEHGICPRRFTERQEEVYKRTDVGFHKNTLTAAGMKLCFETDSTSLFLKVNVSRGSSRTYFSFDVMVNGELVDYLDNFSDVELPVDYTKMELPHGEFSKYFALGEGIKQVCIYLPWSVAVEINEVSVDDNAFVRPVKPAKKMLVFGDSITQGYDALRPSNRYVARLAEKFDSEEINKGIGGEVFFPELAESPDNFETEYVLVAYGTNEWIKSTEEDFKERCYAFYRALSQNYPNAKIFAITPIWRKDSQQKSPFGDFCKVKTDIQEIVKVFENIICIDGYEFVPQDEIYFADLRLHPNDSGFDFYFRSLSQKIKDEFECKKADLKPVE